MTSVKCPHCQKPVNWEPQSLFRPFCSERCRLIDLGAWADGSYAVPVHESPDEPDQLGSEQDPEVDE